MTRFTLSEIHIYPVKSLAGISVNVWEVDNRGLRYDRHWMLIDQNNRFLSARSLPRMLLIKTALTETALVLSAPGQHDLFIPLQASEGTRIQSRLWQDQCSVQHISKEADQWLSEFLKHDCKLVCQSDEKRPVDTKYARQNDQTSLSDGFPFLIISESSLAVLNQKMTRNIPMLRFRPNLVIAGCTGFAEDYWRAIQIGSIGFRLPKPCSRCIIPAVDTETAQIHKEPLKTLNQFRKWKNQVYFGQNAIHDHTGTLHTGAPVNIVQTGAPQPPLAGCHE